MRRYEDVRIKKPASGNAGYNMQGGGGVIVLLLTLRTFKERKLPP
jgi:hypothetical protein